MNFNQIGNIAHVFIGIILGYCILNLTDVYTVNQYGWFLGFMFSTLALVFIGGAWELFQNRIFKIQGNINDIVYTAIGGAIGGVLASFYKDLTLITTYGIIVSILAVIGYVYLMNKNKEVATKVIYIPVGYEYVNQNEFELVRLINEYRKSIRVCELKVERLACVIAEQHVDYMTETNHASHYNYNKRFEQSKADFCGEIIQQCPKNSAQYVFQAYMESPTHKKSMSNPVYEWIGVSYKENFTMCFFTKYNK